MEDNYLGHNMQYWVNLNSRPKEFGFEDLLQEIADLEGKLAFIESRLNQINTLLKI